MATGARGEGILELDGETYEVLFTLRALADAERATGKTVLQIMAAGKVGALGINDTVALLAVGLEYARRDHRRAGSGTSGNDAWRLLEQLGFAACATVVMEALAAVMSYSRPQEAKADPPG